MSKRWVNLLLVNPPYKKYQSSSGRKQAIAKGNSNSQEKKEDISGKVIT